MDDKTQRRRGPVETGAQTTPATASEIVERRTELKRSPDSVIAAYGGPLPLPAHFEHFEKVLPGAAERILGMAEAEQRSRLSIEQHESLVATDLAKREAALQEAAIRGRLTIEREGNWLGFAASVLIIGGALAFGYFAPDRTEKIGSFIVAAMFGAAQVVVAFKRGAPPKSNDSQAPPPGGTVQKRRKGR